MTMSTIRRLLSTAVAATMTTVALSAALSPAQGKRVQQAADVLSAIHKGARQGHPSRAVGTSRRA